MKTKLTENHELRWIQQTSRPIRYAFIVDPKSIDVSKQLSDIFQFSLRMWGGRLNAIIPLIEGTISQKWWEIFKICDPDKVVICTPLSEDIIKKIYTNINPAEIIILNDRYPILAPRQCPVGALEIPKFQERNSSYGKRKKYYCIKSNRKDGSEKHRFIEVNFGCYDDIVLVSDSFKNINSKEILLASESDPLKLIDEISSLYDEKAIFPMDICEVYSSKPYKAEYDSFSSSLQIIVGNSPLDLIYFWNRYLYTEGHNGRDTVWIPPEILADEESADKIGKWISSSYYGGGNGSNLAHIVSFSADNLDIYAKKLQKNFHSIDIKTKKMFAECPPSILSIPDYGATENLNGLSDHLTSMYRGIFENGSFSISPRKPPFYCSDSSRFANSYFAVDFKIEHTFKRFENITETLQIPQRFGNSFSIFGYAPKQFSRINRLGYPTRIVDTQSNGLELSIPSVQKILAHYSYDIPKTVETNVWYNKKSKFHLQESEDGIELKKLIDLYGNLDELGQFLEDPFLTKLSFTLSNIMNLEGDNQAKFQKIKLTINELFDIALPGTKINDDTISTCAHILDERMNIFFNKPNQERSIKKLFNLFGTLRSQAINENENLNFWNAYKKFADAHEELLEHFYQKGIFLQGFCQQCPFCSHTDWYNIAVVSNRINCNSCSSSFHLKLAPEFQIRINESVATAFKKNSYIYVAWALYHLQRDSISSSFQYLHSHDIFPNGEKNKLTDLDLIIIKNGKLGIGEVKSDPISLLQNNTFEKLEKAASLLLPNEVYVSAPVKKSWPEDVIKAVEKMRKRLEVLEIKTILYPIPPIAEWTNSKNAKKKTTKPVQASSN